MALSDRSRIEWTEATWNPVTGCHQVSPGCAHCYAKTFAERWEGIPGHPYEQGFGLRMRPERLAQPLKWKRSRTIFVDSMSDMFHELIPSSSSLRYSMSCSPRTSMSSKSSRNGPTVLLSLRRSCPRLRMCGWASASKTVGSCTGRTSCEKSPLRSIISAEPLLGPLEGLDLNGIHWLIAGGESGPRHRPVRAPWARALREQCSEADVAFFFKQWGGRTPKAGGRDLDGQTWDGMPARPSLAAA